MSCPPLNCSSWDRVQPNSDISGIGVLLAFGVSAYLTLAFCVAFYLFDEHTTLNPVDVAVRQKIARWIDTPSSKRWGEKLRTVVLAYSDQQSLTGIAILVSSFSQLACSIAVYHWLLTFDLAWFSSITHLTTLTCLRHYFHTRPALRIWRLICMAITVIMLAVFLATTGYIGSPYPDAVKLSLPAWCLFHERLPRYQNGYIGITSAFLVVAYSSRVIQLFPKATEIMRCVFRERPSHWLQEWLQRLENRATHASHKVSRISWSMLHRLLLSVWCMLKAMSDLWTSLLWEITWLLIALVWGTIRIKTDLQGNLDYFSIDDPIPTGENSWGFGQVVALIMVVLPLVSFFDISTDGLSKYERVKSRHDSRYLNSDMHYEGSTAIDVQESQGAISGPVTELHHLTSDASPSNQALQQQNPRTSLPYPKYDLYRYKWFHLLILLTYFLSLALASLLICIFLVFDLIKELDNLSPSYLGVFPLVPVMNLLLTWIFALVGVSSLELNPVLHISPRLSAKFSHLLRSWNGQAKDTMGPKMMAWVRNIAWFLLIITLVGISSAWGFAWLMIITI